MAMNISSLLSGASSLVVAQKQARAAIAWGRIQDKPTSVTFRTSAGGTLPSQTVRIEYDNPATEATSEAGEGAWRKLTIFGIRDHATLPNTDMKRGYRVVLDGKEYSVVDMIGTHGEVQARAEAVS